MMVGRKYFPVVLWLITMLILGIPTLVRTSLGALSKQIHLGRRSQITVEIESKVCKGHGITARSHYVALSQKALGKMPHRTIVGVL
jgi:hypothetical protein